MQPNFDQAYLKRTGEAPAVRRIKSRAIELLGLNPGDHVIDVGCGPAIDTLALARAVGPTGLAVGVDCDSATVDEANSIAVREGLGAQIRHLAGNATALPLESDTFDAGFCERVLQHVFWPDAAKVAAELLRVVKPGGRISIIDTDWATLSIAFEDPFLERRIVTEHAARFANPYSGRYLKSLLRSAGIAELQLEIYDLQLGLDAVDFLLRPAIQSGITTGRISVTEAQRWYFGLKTSQEYGRFFAHVCMVLATGHNGRLKAT